MRPDAIPGEMTARKTLIARVARSLVSPAAKRKRAEGPADAGAAEGAAAETAAPMIAGPMIAGRMIAGPMIAGRMNADSHATRDRATTTHGPPSERIATAISTIG
jgi:hypothetical protein